MDYYSVKLFIERNPKILGVFFNPIDAYKDIPFYDSGSIAYIKGDYIRISFVIEILHINTKQVLIGAEDIT